MEIGEEISQKIRSAIKAKLVDLGAYVDDELPDYIMVMVANRKTQPQMTEDLNLFLGNHTDVFTTWLHGLLEKLQSITADKTESDGKPEDTVKEPVKEKEEVTQVVIKEKPLNEKPEQAEPIIHLNPDHDEFEEVSKSNEQKDKAKAKRRHSNAEEKSRPSQESRHTSSSSRSNRDKEKHSHSSKASSKHSSESSKKEDHSSSSSHQRTSATSRLGPRKKSAGLASSVGAVIKHDDYVSDDEYDPLNPSVGSVASIIKVSERKSTLPPSLQANKSLLFKAMKDAEHSVTTKKPTGKGEAESLTKQTSREEERERESSRRRKEREARHTAAERMDSGQERVTSVRSRLGAKRSSVKSRLGDIVKSESERDISGDKSIQITRRVKQEPKSGTERKRRSGEGGMRSAVLSTAASAAADSCSSAVVRPKKRRTTQEPIDLTQDEDSRRIECSVRMRSLSPQPAGDTRNIQTQQSVEEVLDVLIESGTEEFSDDDILIQSASEVQSMYAQPASAVTASIHSGGIARQQSDNANPKFVVTLDGVDPFTLGEDNEAEMQPVNTPPPRTASSSSLYGMYGGYGSGGPMESTPKNMAMVRPQPPAVEPVTINLRDDEDDGHREPSDQPIAKTEKCRFFPACKNGDQCPYVHPTTSCTNFPNCRFGDRCLYVHPNCKFDAACTRANCPFTHTAKKSPTAQPPVPLVLQPIGVPMMFPRPPVPAAPAFRPPRPHMLGETTCRFFPNCTNMNCPFKHPKPCRFGVACTNKALCRFSHPPLPSTSKLRWTPQLAQAARAAEQLPAALSARKPGTVGMGKIDATGNKSTVAVLKSKTSTNNTSS